MPARLTNKAAAAVVLLALILLPAPLLPPSGVVGLCQSMLGLSWKTAYLGAALGLHVAVYGCLGALAAFAVGPGEKTASRSWRLLVVPACVVCLALLVRSLKLGHIPMLANSIVPMAACILGALISLLFRQHGWRVALAVLAGLLVAMASAYWPGASELRSDTEACLRRFVEAGSTLPPGDERFAALVKLAFEPVTSASAKSTAVSHNSAAILALGIALGDERLARHVRLDHHSELVRAAAALRADTTLRGRNDWVRHYCVSATLVIVESPFFSDAGGLIKEQLDALTRGSGFSFGDLAADRAGARFAQVATGSETSALAMQARLRDGYAVDDFFPIISDLPENLTLEQFRREYGGVGSRRYRQTVDEIEARLDLCAVFATSLPR